MKERDKFKGIILYSVFIGYVMGLMFSVVSDSIPEVGWIRVLIAVGMVVGIYLVHIALDRALGGYIKFGD